MNGINPKQVKFALKRIAKNIDHTLLKLFKTKLGFTVIIYTEKESSYISNCSRKQSIKELKKLVSELEKEEKENKENDRP